MILRRYLHTPYGYQDCESPSHFLRMKTQSPGSTWGIRLSCLLFLWPVPLVSRLTRASQPLPHISSYNLMNYSKKQGYAFWILTSLSIAHDFEIYKHRQLSSQMTYQIIFP